MGGDKIQWEDGQGRPGRRPDEEVLDRVLAEIKKEDPERAKQLSELREKNPDEFQNELREHGREYFAKVARQIWDERRKESQEEFLKWLDQEYPEEAKELAKVRETGDAELYGKKVEITNRKYRRIYDAWRWNPEMGKILKEDLALKEVRDELIEKVKAETDRSKKVALRAQLQRTVERRFDLIVRRKQIAYEQLLKRLEELQQLIKQSRDDLIKAQDKEYKEENVKKRMKDLLDEQREFNWSD